MAEAGLRHRKPAEVLRSTAVDRRSFERVPERSVHRGRSGASLQTPRAGRLGFGGLADGLPRPNQGDTRATLRRASVSRDVEARGSEWTHRRPARPRHFVRERRLARRSPQRAKAGGLQTTAPRSAENPGGGALAKSTPLFRGASESERTRNPEMQRPRVALDSGFARCAGIPE